MPDKSGRTNLLKTALQRTEKATEHAALINLIIGHAHASGIEVVLTAPKKGLDSYEKDNIQNSTIIESTDDPLAIVAKNVVNHFVEVKKRADLPPGRFELVAITFATQASGISTVVYEFVPDFYGMAKGLLAKHREHSASLQDSMEIIKRKLQEAGGDGAKVTFEDISHALDAIDEVAAAGEALVEGASWIDEEEEGNGD